MVIGNAGVCVWHDSGMDYHEEAIMAKGKITILKRAIVVCGECDNCEVVLDKGWLETERELRKRGWSRADARVWLCPTCATKRRVNKRVSCKTFRGLFTRGGKEYVKSRDGNIYPVGKVKDV